MPEGFKVRQPKEFDGSDTSLSAVKAWAFSAEEYMALAAVPKDSQTRLAGSWLDGTAKIWYMNTYQEVDPLPEFSVFIKAFKEHHQTSHSDADLIKRVESIRQGFKRNTSEYSTEYKMLIIQLGKPDPRWATHHYLRGLDRNVRSGLIPSLTGEETLDALIKRAGNVARNLDFGKSLDATPSTQNVSRSSTSQATYPNVPKPSGRHKFPSKLTESEREYLRNNKGCYLCRKTNVDHIASNCPDKVSSSTMDKERSKEVKKESVSALGAIVESDSESEYPRSVPTIKLATIIENTTLPASLVDCGATINLISSEKVKKHAIATHPTPPVRIHEPLNPKGVLVNKKVVSKVSIPEEAWESAKPAELLVAPLQDNDVILGMPFLASENILIDPAHGKIILPANGGDKEDDKEDKKAEEEEEDNVAEEEEEDNVAEEEEEDNVAEEEEEDKEAEEEEEDGNGGDEEEEEEEEEFDYWFYCYLPATMPSNCPKMVRITPPDLSWIAALKDFDETPSERDTSATTTLKEALQIDKNYLQLNEKYISEFTDVFTDKLPNKLPSPEAPRHRIILEDEKISING
jgi:hypothetical protein